ncbi:DNA-binding protein H-NS [Nitrobacteraceae bacterium AZCC 1564]
MPNTDLDEMQFNELWLLHEEITEILTDRIVAEKRELEKRLAQLNRSQITRERPSKATSRTGSRPRRKYPRVLPKYRNPSAPSETWSGRGKLPRWLVVALDRGYKMDDFRIAHNAATTE